MRTYGRHNISAVPRKLSVNYKRVAPAIRLYQEISNSLKPSKNEAIETISIDASMDIVKFEDLARPVADNRDR